MKTALARLLLLACSALATGAFGAAPAAIGDAVEGLEFKDIRYARRSLSDLGEARAYVLAFTTLECPLVKRYLPRLESLHKTFGPRGVHFLAVNVGPGDSIQEMAWQALEHGVSFHFVKDPHGAAARRLGVSRTPEVVVLDAGRKLRYRGRIDNQYRIGGVRPEADEPDLQAALEAVLREEPVKNPITPVDGCAITFPEERAPRAGLTYARDIAPLMNRHCVECHRPNTEAPFALTTYEQVSSKARMIAEVVEDGQMPPWYAHPRFGEFKNARVMSAEEKQILSDWIQTGKAPGDLASAPPPPPFPDSQWQIGEPDLLVRAMKEEEIPATGYIPYRYIAFPHVFTHDTWIQGIQIQPSNPRVVHHANLAYVTLGKGFDVREGFLTGRVPGGIPVQLDPGVAMLIPKGAMLAVQAHYVTTGKPEKDRISVGFRYARGTIHKRVRYKILANYSFAIPPGVSAHPVLASDTLECDATGLGLFQHMHLRGKDTTFLAHYPNGRSEVVLAIPNYSFDWQIAYVWKDGYQKFPKGTRLENRSHFDNSRFNPFNPDPLATVRDGPQTHHEMMQGYFFYTDDAEHLSIQVDPKTGREILSRSQAAAD